MKDITCNLKEFTARNPNGILKKAHLVSGKVIIVLDDGLLKNLQLDIENAWFSEENVENGILLKPTNLSTMYKIESGFEHMQFVDAQMESRPIIRLLVVRLVMLS